MFMKKYILIIFFYYFQITYEVNIKFYKNKLQITHIFNRKFYIRNISKTILFNDITQVCVFGYFPIIRNHIYHSGIMKSVFNDPDLGQQWYFLKANSNNYLTHDLESLWERNITGNGVIIGIIGGGMQVDHKDLRRNHISNLSYNFAEESTHIFPTLRYPVIEYTGLIVASSNNNECGVGAAPSSSFSSLQIFNDESDELKDELLSRAILWNYDKIYVYIFICNIIHDLKIRVYPGPLTYKALEFGFMFGRNGLGNIYLISSGLRCNNKFRSTFNDFAQRLEIFVIGTILNNGSSAIYCERYSSILASAISTATQRYYDLLYSIQQGDRCSKAIGGVCGISSSIATGIIALLLSDNPLLTVRQVFLSIILSSTQYDHTAIKNAAGFRYSDSLGFGMLNASELIRISKETQILNPGQQNICKIIVFRRKAEIEKNSSREFYIYSDGCLDTKCCVTTIEQMFFKFTLKAFSRNTVTLYITSPSGTTLKIVDLTYNYYFTKEFNEFTFKILGFFGETTIGYWMIKIYSENYSSFLKKFIMDFYGTCDYETYLQQVSTTNISQFFINQTENDNQNQHRNLSYIDMYVKGNRIRYSRQAF